MYEEGRDAREQRVRSHSARVAILAKLALEDRELTAAQVRATLPEDMNLRTVYYHLRALKASRLIVEDEGRYMLP